MTKKGKNGIRIEKIISLVLFVIFLISFFISLGIFHWQKRKADIAEQKLEEQMSSFKALIKEYSKPQTKNDIIPPSEIQIMKDSYNADSGISFTDCGYAGLFKTEKWYPDFTEKIDKLGITAKNISSMCLSADKTMAILIAQTDKYCEGPKIYRYNPINGNLSPAEVLNKGVQCLGSLKRFGKRDGNIISMSVPGTGECRREEYYDYDFIKNVIELKKSRSLCNGDSNWKWTEY